MTEKSNSTPLLSQLTYQSWDTFLVIFRQFNRARKEDKQVKLACCLNPKLEFRISRLLSTASSGHESTDDVEPTTLDNISDKALETLLAATVAPRTHLEALARLTSIRLRGPIADRSTLEEFHSQFLYRVSTLPIKFKPSERRLLDLYVSALDRYPAPLRVLLDTMDPATLEEAVILTEEWFALAQGSGLLALSPATPSSSFKSERTADIKSANAKTRRRNNDFSAPVATSVSDSKQAHAEKLKAITCHKCDNKGHYANRCPNEKKTSVASDASSPSYSLRSKATTPSVSMVSCPSSQAIPSDVSTDSVTIPPAPCPVASIELLPTTGFWPTPVRLDCLLDSGASINLISSTFLAQLPADSFIRRPFSSQIDTAAAGGSLKVDCLVDFTILIAQTLDHLTEFPICFHVCSNLQATTQAIIGHPFLSSNSLYDLVTLVTKSSTSPCDVSTPTAEWQQLLADYDNLDTTPIEEAFHKDQSLLSGIKALRSEFSSCFQPTPEPAKLPAVRVTLPAHFVLPEAKPRRLSIPVRAHIDAQLNELLALNVISPTTSPHCSPIVAVRKGESYRMVVDYRAVNSQLPSMPFALLDTETIIEKISGFRYYGRCDLYRGFYQLALSPECRDQLAFVTPSGAFTFNRLPMGLKQSPALFHSAMLTAFADLSANVCVYLDDLIIFADDQPTYLATIRSVLQRCSDLRLTLNSAKCLFALSTVHALGFMVTAEGYTMPQAKRFQLSQLPPPTNVTSLRSFLGLANYFRKFVPNYALRTKPLSALLGGGKVSKKALLQWTAVHQTAFEDIRSAASNVPLLSFPAKGAQLHLYTDASNLGIGAVLMQQLEQTAQSVLDLAKAKPIGFVSEAFSGAQLNWSTIEMEAYAIVKAVKTFEPFLQAVPFTVHCDHRNLQYLSKSTSSKLQRWRLTLAEFDFVIKHIPGLDNVAADALSRLFSDSSSPPAPQVNCVQSAQRGTAPVSDQTVSFSEISDDVLRTVHNSVTGHFGIDETCRRLRNLGFSINAVIRTRISKYLLHCAFCQKITHSQVPQSQSLSTTMVDGPFQKLSFDFIGPLPRDHQGNAYILTVIDNFTRFTELFAVPAADAANVAPSLLSLIGRYGCFTQLASDRGTHFVNAVIDQLTTLLHLDHTLSVPYSPQSNGAVERCNASVMRHLRSLTFAVKSHEHWSRYVPLVQRILNSHPSATTGLAPAQLLYGSAINLDRSLLDNNFVTAPADATKSVLDAVRYANDLVHIQRQLAQIALSRQRKILAAYLAKTPAAPTIFEPGTQVLVRYPPDSKKKIAKPTKLHGNFFGPCVIVTRTNNRYRLRNILEDTEFDAHLDRLQPYFPDVTLTDLEVASLDVNEFQVEDIIDHRCPSKRKTDIQFLVRWDGYDSAYDSWTSYKDVKRLAVLKKYASLHNLHLY